MNDSLKMSIKELKEKGEAKETTDFVYLKGVEYNKGLILDYLEKERGLPVNPATQN